MTTRQFKLYGIPSGSATGTVAVDGITVFNGTFGGDSTAATSVLTSGSLTFNDTEETVQNFTVTVNTGSVQVGLVEWNMAYTKNRLYTTEEWDTFGNFDTLISDQLALAQSKSVTPFTSEELAAFNPTDVTLYQKIVATTSLENAQLQQIYYDHGVSQWYRYTDCWGVLDTDNSDEDTWSYFSLGYDATPSPNAEQQQYIRNFTATRSNPQVDGLEPSGVDLAKFVTVPAGSTLTFGAVVFPGGVIIR